MAKSQIFDTNKMITNEIAQIAAEQTFKKEMIHV